MLTRPETALFDRWIEAKFGARRIKVFGYALS
jgi:hypothetical protein